ncbi:MAG TPA: helix-turn-helix transcriptional regulator [Jiangellaceae bacterium]
MAVSDPEGTVVLGSVGTIRGRGVAVVLVRRLIGDVLRRRRVDQGRTLREVSAAARVSLGYLSEVERGRKEASSELLAAICQALDLPMSEVLREVSDEMMRVEAAAVGALTELRPRESARERDVVAVA